ncbi:MAG: SAM-dependent methyltransferase [Lachnospiraceae bacterium]|nr:SAM-dependent methyltransferase [Lachnospiraceae bacterium]
MIELSKRMQAVADMVTPGLSVTDIGCDHGFVSIYLMQQNIATGVIAMDVNEGPLKIAKSHIEEYGLSEYIETRLSDGLSAINPMEAESMVCAGMGGRLMIRILTDEIEKARGMKEIILQPQSELGYVRRSLLELGFQIVDENMVCEEGKYYVIMKVLPGNEAEYTQYAKDDISLEFGTVLLQKKHPVLKEYLNKMESQYSIILSQIPSDNEKSVQDRQNMEHKLSQVKKALELLE